MSFSFCQEPKTPRTDHIDLIVFEKLSIFFGKNESMIVEIRFIQPFAWRAWLECIESTFEIGTFPSLGSHFVEPFRFFIFVKIQFKFLHSLSPSFLRWRQVPRVD